MGGCVWWGVRLLRLSTVTGEGGSAHTCMPLKTPGRRLKGMDGIVATAWSLGNSSLLLFAQI